MSMKNDISNLLSKFGADGQQYIELDSIPDYKEITPLATTASAANTQPSVRELVEQIVNTAPVSLIPLSSSSAASNENTQITLEPPADQAVSAKNGEPLQLIGPTHTSKRTSLRFKLEEVALKRQKQEGTAAHSGSINQGKIPAHVIAISSIKGGAGKSVLTAALSTQLGQQHKVIVIELDSQNVLQYYMDSATNTESVGLLQDEWRTALQQQTDNIFLLPFGDAVLEQRTALLAAMQKDTNWLAKKLVGLQLKKDDIVILDTPTGQSLYLDQALSIADQVIVPITLDAGSFMAIDQIERLLNEAQPAGTPMPLNYVVNRFDNSRTFCNDMLEVFKDRLGSSLIGVLPFSATLDEELAFGSAPLTTDEEETIQEALSSVTEAIKSHISSSAAIHVKAAT